MMDDKKGKGFMAVLMGGGKSKGSDEEASSEEGSALDEYDEKERKKLLRFAKEMRSAESDEDYAIALEGFVQCVLEYGA